MIKGPGRHILQLFIALFIADFTMAQDTPPELVTDRPDQTESSAVVPIRSLQIETGFILENDETGHYKQRAWVYNMTLLRYGLLENFELRAGLAYSKNRMEIKNTDTVTTTSGTSPLYAGFKLYVTDEKGWIPQVSLIGGLIFPFTASGGYQPEYTGMAMRFACSHTLSDRVSLGYNLGAEWSGSSVIPGYFYSVVLGFAITGKFGIYAENYGLIPEKGDPLHLVDGGITYLVLPNLQLDASGGIGINESAPDNYVSVGLSYRLPR